MAQTGSDPLFAHWSVAPDALRPVVPPELEQSDVPDRAGGRTGAGGLA